MRADRALPFVRGRVPHLGALLEILDTTIVNVALPDIQGNVGASQEEGTFIVTGYILAGVVIIPLSPWLQQRNLARGARRGRRRIALGTRGDCRPDAGTACWAA
jgi:MFS family permease